MSDVPIQLIVAAFQEEKAADEALSQLKQAKWAGLIGIKDAAVVRRDAKDKIHIKDVKDVGGRKGSIAGGVFGVGIALLTGGAGIVLAGATGALVGGLAAKKIDMGLPNKRLKELGEALKPETSAIIAVIEHKWVAELEREMAAAGAQVMTDALKADIAEQLASGKDISYTVISAEGGMAVERVASDEDSVEISDIVATEDGVAISATVATKDGMANQSVIITEDGVLAATTVATIAAGTDDDAAADADADEDEEA